MKHLRIFAVLLLTGCASSLSTMDWKPADAPQTTPPPVASNGKPQVKQWFTTETPETLPQDKLDQMSLGGGVGGAY